MIIFSSFNIEFNSIGWSMKVIFFFFFFFCLLVSIPNRDTHIIHTHTHTYQNIIKYSMISRRNNCVCVYKYCPSFTSDNDDYYLVGVYIKKIVTFKSNRTCVFLFCFLLLLSLLLYWRNFLMAPYVFIFLFSFFFVVNFVVVVVHLDIDFGSEKSLSFGTIFFSLPTIS